MRSLTNPAPGGITAPSAGVIVRWRMKIGAGAPTNLARLHTISGNTGVAVSDQVPVPATAGIFEFPTRIPVSAGQALGLDLTDVFPNPTMVLSAAGGSFDFWAPELGATETRAPNSAGLGDQLLINADLEPDADNDGFGDETQDCAPDDASRHDDCSPPETSIIKGPKHKTRKRRATFEFASSEPGSTFECSLDAGAFAPCASPDTLKVKKGKHTFSVRAKDPAGNADGSPASDDWKVKRKRKK